MKAAWTFIFIIISIWCVHHAVVILGSYVFQQLGSCISLFRPTGPNVVSTPHTKNKKCFEISWFYWIHPMVLEKLMSYFWKLKLGFWTYGLIRRCKRLSAKIPLNQFLGSRLEMSPLGSIYIFFFMSSSIKFCMKQDLIFKFWVIFDKVMSVSRVIFHVKLHNPPHLTPMDFVENFVRWISIKNWKSWKFEA